MLKLDKQTKDYTDIYNNYYALIHSIAYGKIGNAVDAEDISQEVFIRFFEKYSEVREARKWLLGTLRLVILEYYRRKENKDVNVDEVFNDVSLSFANGFKDIRLIIADALENIEAAEGQTEKVIFDLIAVHNYSFQNVANQLGLTKKKVRYRYNKIVTGLLDYFNKRGIKNFEALL